ncbi:MAG: apolipoprotein N-acyltransferase [Chthonomonadales bacterium]|nr:apolipoprotein N-acyltransferase [Chthonomonadales bacterium]
MAAPRAQRARPLGLVVLAAALATLAFPPADQGWLAWFALAPLLLALRGPKRLGAALGLGYLFGVLHWGGTIPWIGTTVVDWSGTPLGWAAWVGLTAIEAGWFALAGALTWAIGRRSSGAARALGIAAAWTLTEWLRAQGRLSMPWSLLGYTQYRWLPVIQVADLCGVYGISFLVVLTSAALAEALCPAGPGRRGRLTAPLLAIALIAVSLGYGGWRLARPAVGEPLRVALIQPDIRDRRGAIRDPVTDLALFASLSTRAGRGADLVVWPEGIAPRDVFADPRTRAGFAAIARATGAYQLVGTGTYDTAGRAYNAACLFAPDGAIVGRYAKQWLVPFGEWMPARPLFERFESVFHFGMEDTAHGGRQPPLRAGRARIGVLICFESIFPEMARRYAAEGANLLACITNDSWGGRSAAPAQHMAMTAFRAVETRRWTVVAATTGVTGIVAPSGARREAPPFQVATLAGTAGLLDARTPYVRLGDWLAAACAALATAALLLPRCPAPERPERRRRPEGGNA